MQPKRTWILAIVVGVMAGLIGLVTSLPGKKSDFLMPDYKGMTLTQVKDSARDLGHELRMIGDERALEDPDAWTVGPQSTAPGTQSSPGDSVSVFVFPLESPAS